MSALTYTMLPDRGVLKLSGDDARTMLQGIVTNDVEKVSEQKAIYALLLTPQGKFLFDFFIAQSDGALLLDVSLAEKEILKQRLAMYKLRSDVTIEDISDTYEVAAIMGESVFEVSEMKSNAGAARPFCKGVMFVDPRSPALFGRSILEKENEGRAFESKGAVRTTPDAYEALRISLTVPEGTKDMIREESFPMQYNMDGLNAIDFSKGCYVGQEVTARSKHLGTLRKTVYTVQGEGQLPEVGSVIEYNGAKAGILRSHHEGSGIALLEIEKANDAPSFTVAGKEIRLRA
jgi:hypothetical protein